MTYILFKKIYIFFLTWATSSALPFNISIIIKPITLYLYFPRRFIKENSRFYFACAIPENVLKIKIRRQRYIPEL